MDYFKVLKLDKDSTIVDVVGMYQVLSKRIKKEIKAGTSTINELNELNTAYLIACTTKNPDELVNAKNEYFLGNKVMLIINRINETIATLKKESNTGYGIYFAELIAILNKYLSGYYRLVNLVKRAKTKEEFQSIIKEFANYNWNAYFIKKISQFSYDTLVPAIYYTKDNQEFIYGLTKTKTSLELLNYLNSRLAYFKKLEIVNETLINNMLYNNFDISSLTDSEANTLNYKITEQMVTDTKLNHLTLDELMQKYNSSVVENTEKKLAKELGFNGNFSNN